MSGYHPDVAPLTRQITVRVTDELFKRIEQDARDNGRSPAQTIRFHLERAFEKGDGG